MIRHGAGRPSMVRSGSAGSNPAAMPGPNVHGVARCSSAVVRIGSDHAEAYHLLWFEQRMAPGVTLRSLSRGLVGLPA